jgi:cbb3-type cytochrome oxidase maturation protein
MEILYLLVPISVVLVFLIGIAFWWSLRSGQYDDLEGPGYRVLMDDDKVRGKSPEPPDKTRKTPPTGE